MLACHLLRNLQQLLKLLIEAVVGEVEDEVVVVVDVVRCALCSIFS